MTLDRRLSIAPMMDWTDRHCRYFHRLLAPHALLYTEMVTTGALLHGHIDRHLQFSDAEHPVALQLGGSDPKALAQSAKIGADYGYDEINLNVGCPSSRVQNGAFGACLMKEPKLVAACVQAMRDAVKIPVTVKTRLGIDHHDDYEFAHRFIEIVSQKGGANVFILHARKAWLSGLSPKENRDIPPLQWERVYQLKKDFPNLHISINGGIQTVEHVEQVKDHVDGIMVGRAAYQNPSVLMTMEDKIFGYKNPLSKIEIVEKMIPYMEDQRQNSVPLKSITRHMLGLFRDQKGARQWRRLLSENAPDLTIDHVREALRFVSD